MVDEQVVVGPVQPPAVLQGSLEVRERAFVLPPVLEVDPSRLAQQGAVLQVVSPDGVRF